MTDILKHITDKLQGKITEANFEGANIVLYTNNENFFREGESRIKELVDEIKKRIELRADQKILHDQEKVKEEIMKIVPGEADITNIIFDTHRSIVVVEAKRPGMVIGKQGSVLDEIKKTTLWTPQIQRSPAIKSQITENIREVLYANNNYRRKFLNSIGEKIYKGWNPEKVEEWVRLTMLGSAREVGRSCMLLQTPNSKILLDCGINVAGHGKDKFPYFDIPEFNIQQLDAIVLSHAHLDHVGLLPYLYKMGYKGPVYMTDPTMDLAALLCLDFIGVAYKQAAAPLYSSKDIKEMVKHTVCLNFNEVTDIAPDIRITFYNSGHALGSAMVHFNIGNGLHNFLYSADYKYARTRLLDPAVTTFPRVESVLTEATYGAKTDILPPRIESEEKMLEIINKTINRGGKVLI
ncbi:MAG: MBL fold metallo-hydrolase, partial [Nanoarchaeota archaeon]|nr:MBL fold metallo-hydrolase [Nanoarchaeota archaeon]